MSVDPRQSIERKAKLVGGAVVGVIAACAGAGLWSAYALSGALHSSQTSNEALQNHLTADMMHDALRADVLRIFLASDPAFQISREEAEADLTAHAKELRDRIQANKSILTGDAQRVVAAVSAPLDGYVRAAVDIMETARVNPEAARKQLPDFQARFEALETAMANASESINAVSAKEAARSSSEATTFQILTLLLAVLGVGLCVYLVLASRRTLVRPLGELTDTMAKLADGDISVTTSLDRRQDEIGAIAKAMASFRASEIERRKLRDEQEDASRRAEKERVAAVEAAETLVVQTFGTSLARLAAGDLSHRLTANLPKAYERLKSDYNAAIERLRETVKTVVENTSAISAGTSEIAHASDNLSKRTEQQAASLEETAAALEEVTAAIKKTADGAKVASGMIVTARADAEKGGVVINNTVKAMSAIEKSSTQISQIIGVIDEIAFQTNLLALNAGVEAARAGDAGRGFAVVAQEVRALAQRSAAAAKEIKELISASTSQVGEGVRLVDQTGDALHRIVSRVLEIDTVVAEIAASANEQSSALGEVNAAVNLMDQATQQNAAMVEQSTAATHSLEHETASLVELMKTFELGEVQVTQPARSPSRAAQRPPPPPRQPAQKPVVQGNLAVASHAPAGDDWEEF